jgi:hypothetical protein
MKNPLTEMLRDFCVSLIIPLMFINQSNINSLSLERVGVRIICVELKYISHWYNFKNPTFHLHNINHNVALHLYHLMNKLLPLNCN